MVVIKSPAEYAVIVRSLAKELPLYRHGVITDLNEVAGILEDLDKPPMVIDTGAGFNIAEDEV